MAQALFARTCFACELARRLEGTGVTSVAFHPGLIKSNLGRHLAWPLRIMTHLMNLSAKSECAIGEHVAAAPEIERMSGVFFHANQQIVPIHRQFDDETSKRLWQLSEKLTGLSAVFP